MVQVMSFAPGLAVTLAAALFAFAAASPAVAAPPAVGDTFVYRVINGYNSEVRGHLRYRVDAVHVDRVMITATSDTPSLGPPQTHSYTLEGNWLRHPLINHDQPVDYEFSPAYAAYEVPLDAGKSWSVRVNATAPLSGRRAPACKPVPRERHGPWPANSRSRPPTPLPEGEWSIERNRIMIRFRNS